MRRRFLPTIVSSTAKPFHKTKVIATLGPACADEQTLKEMLLAGMDVARLNMSHADEASHARMLHRVRAVAQELGITLAVMMDTRGREIRTGKLEQGRVQLDRGQAYSLYADGRLGDSTGFSTNHPDLYRHVAPGHRILLDDGSIELVVTDVEAEVIRCRVECAGVLLDSKGVNLPDSTSAYDQLEFNDDHEIRFAAEQEVDYIAASFSCNADEIRDLRKRLKALKADIPIIAKIENRDGVDNLDEIVEAANGVMVARGDLGVELNMGEGPTIQKRIIRATVSRGKPVITATQMLDSMERNPRPTRAEVSDVANAIFDGSSAVMLSGETAVGCHPVAAVRTMVELAIRAEAGLQKYGYLQQIRPSPSNEITEAVAQAAITVADNLKSAAILALTETGRTARLISKYRPACPILAVVPSERVMRRLLMNWGVSPIHCGSDSTDDDKIRHALERGREQGLVSSGDTVVLTSGSSHKTGSTNLIRVLTVD